MIQTLKKKIKIDDVKGKFNLAHEHLDFDLTCIREDNNSKSESTEITIRELYPLQKQGLGLIVDLSNHSMHSNKLKIHKIEKELNIPIVTSTGFYMNKYEKGNEMSIKDMVSLFVKDITIGIKQSGIKAGIIGEIATSSKKIYTFEKKVFKAASLTQQKTGVPIYTHVDLGRHALQQVKMLLDNNANPSKVIIGHAEFLKYSEIEKILKKGFNIGIDTIGKNHYIKDINRLEMITKIIEDGWEDRIVLSLDISRKSYLSKNNGYGYGYFYNNFIKRLENTISNDQLHKISFYNILKILDNKG